MFYLLNKKWINLFLFTSLVVFSFFLLSQNAFAQSGIINGTPPNCPTGSQENQQGAFCVCKSGLVPAPDFNSCITPQGTGNGNNNTGNGSCPSFVAGTPPNCPGNAHPHEMNQNQCICNDNFCSTGSSCVAKTQNQNNNQTTQCPAGQYLDSVTKTCKNYTKGSCLGDKVQDPITPSKCICPSGKKDDPADNTKCIVDPNFGTGTTNSTSSSPLSTAADKTVGFFLNAMLTPLMAVIKLLQILFAFGLLIVSASLSIVLYFNMTILDPTSISYAFIEVGMNTLRDVANLGFVLFIILIALATIVRFKDYEAKKLLPKLIAAAILVNFSLAIPSVVLNFTHILGNYFMDLLIPEAGTTTGTLIRALPKQMQGPMSVGLSLSGMVKPKIISAGGEEQSSGEKIMENVKKYTGIGMGVFEVITNLMLELQALLVSIVGTFIIIGMIFMFLARLVWLNFLFVVAPITWLLWVIPRLGSYFTQWWSKFLKYSFSFPITIFFVYLAIMMAAGIEAKVRTIDINVYAPGGNLNAYIALAQISVGFMLVFGFLIGAMMAGNSLGIATAGATMRVGKQMANKTKEWAKTGAANTRDAAIRSPGVQKIATNLQGRGKLLSAMGFWGQAKINKKHDEVESKAKKVLQEQTGGDPDLIQKWTGKQILKTREAAGNEKIAETGKKLQKTTKEKEDEIEKENGKQKTILVKLKQDIGLEKQAKEILEKNLTPAEKIEWDNRNTAIKSAPTDQEKNRLEKERNKWLIDSGYGKEIKDIQKTKNDKERSLDAYKEKVEDKKVIISDRNTARRAETEHAENLYKNIGPEKSAEMIANGFKLENTDLAGSYKARKNMVPEVSTEKLQKQIDQLAKTLKQAEIKNTEVQNNPLSKNEEKETSAKYIRNLAETLQKKRDHVSDVTTTFSELKRTRRESEAAPTGHRDHEVKKIAYQQAFTHYQSTIGRGPWKKKSYGDTPA